MGARLDADCAGVNDIVAPTFFRTGRPSRIERRAHFVLAMVNGLPGIPVLPVWRNCGRLAMIAAL